MPALRSNSVAFATALILSSGAIAQGAIADWAAHFDREVPVQLFEGTQGKIGVRGEGIIECYRGIKLSKVYYFTGEIKFIFHENGIEIADENGMLTFGLAEVRFMPRYESSLVLFNSRAYRGYFKCRYQGPLGNVLVLNVVDIEGYLKGVLPGEIGDRTSDEYEAVKAQAVAARTYAVWKLTDTESSGKLSPTVADQVYTGYDAEKEFLSSGIDQTRGEILVYDGSPIAAYYHAVCGGHTSPVEKIWPEKPPAPYLVGAVDDTFCSWAKAYSWNETYAIDTLRKLVAGYFTGRGGARQGDFAEITDINFTIDFESGRVEMMEVVTPMGIFRETSDRIRWVLLRQSNSKAILPSTNFTMEKKLNEGKLVELKIIGLGNGHGVGMCQCGAIGRARAGEKYDSILRHYYGPARIEKIF
jgi:stage II sporulation protein D